MKGYIYRLDFSNGKTYIGLSVNVQERFKSHKNSALKGEVLPVYCAWRKHGEPVLTIIAEADDKELLQLVEIEAIDLYKTLVPHGYNVSKGGDLSPMLIPEVVEKMRKSKKGVPRDPEAVRKTAEKLRGRKMSAAAKEKMSKARIGMKFTEEHKRNLSIAHKGIACSEERKAFVGEFHRKRLQDPAARARASASQKIRRAREQTQRLADRSTLCVC